ncbi:PucR-like helix-turn-helix protein [Halanaerobium saccharolyticum]|uniref:PucR-like helix-turn-helix protein n=1 Tax=Halanaerobium saccharolyticum TaxID=43595 RepID=A0A4R7ZBC6_9FIRM|nr:helix-turn-helix domain-containing protein [Halanaerobium saccharolyticum]RAK11775.1 PucR-like helix-turn-helix protein [Halanaerobium saccharolyticum]TDW07616.1 PucR-like helix-turn-helix protein [Halanaerobium saccharolyticum]TDX64537.1 PucR-like helix-turn-helix protein [Halanaerobium saccharolyticum]
MKMLDIVDLLENHIINHRLNTNPEIIGIQNINSCKENQYSNLLNFTKENLTSGSLDSDNLLVEKNKIDFAELEKSEVKNLIIIKKGSLNNCLNILEAKINETNYLSYIRKRFFEIVVKNGDISSLLKEAYDFLGNPILVADANYRTLGYYPEQKIGDPVWDNMYQDGFVNQKHMIMFDVDQTLEKLLNSDQVIYLDWGFAEEIPRLSAKISDKHELYGTFGVLEVNKKIKNRDYMIVNALSEALLALVKQIQQPTDKLYVIKQSLLANLLDNGINSQQILKKSVDTARVNINGPYYILSVPISKNNLSTNKLKQLHKKLSALINNIQILTHNNNLVIFIHGRNIEAKLNQATKILKEKKLKTGVSNKFNMLSESYFYYQQTKFVFNFFQDKNRFIYNFNEFGERFFINKLIKTENNKKFIHPGVSRILKYDKENETEFAFTLYQYLLSFKDNNYTAKKLNIHRNTLSYRLKKAEKIMQYNLEDHQQCRYLKLSFDFVFSSPV